MIIERSAGRASAAPHSEAQIFLLSQHPPPPKLTPEQRETAERRLIEIIHQGLKELRVDPQEIARRMTLSGRARRLLARRQRGIQETQPLDVERIDLVGGRGLQAKALRRRLEGIPDCVPDTYDLIVLDERITARLAILK